MLPAHLAENIRQQILYYLQSTFSFRDRRVEQAFARFLEDPEDGLFKGPWVQLKRPFRPAPEGIELPFDITVPFHPFLHQYRAWIRLTSKEYKPESTIITTGTGSGKTECYLYPILDHCLRARAEGRKGIKAIILYPMNALAADQEKRFAKTIWKDTALREAGIRVGNYTGRDMHEGSSRDSGTKTMGEDHGISNHGEQQNNPPDILLTNYKMLDFLLMRPRDQKLWRFNDGDVLHYLVLDELHTYDGAQGADVACLIRRLKERLGIGKHRLCVIGTSATLDNRRRYGDELAGMADVTESGTDRLARFASTLFEEDIQSADVIGEDRKEVEEIVLPIIEDFEMPDPEPCVPREDEDALSYAVRQAALWKAPVYEGPADLQGDEAEEAIKEWCVALGDWIKATPIFRELLYVFKKVEDRDEGMPTFQQIVNGLADADPELKSLNFRGQLALVVSFFALIDYAKEGAGDMAFPLVPTQVQLWVRELRRVGRVVSADPAFTWLDEPLSNRKTLPVFHCSECHESGWIALHDKSKDSQINAKGVDGIQLSDNPTAIYRAYFGAEDAKSPDIVIVSPWRENTRQVESPNGQQNLLDFENWYLHTVSLVLRKGAGQCPLTGEATGMPVRVSREVARKSDTGEVYGDQRCPFCGSRTGVFFIGAQSATISSVAVDEMFGSLLNNDPKLLAFTDSVQDASHRAGFLTSRTYRFTFRTALQHVVDEAGDTGLPLVETGSRVIDYWSRRGTGRMGSVKRAIEALIPSDLQQYPDYMDFRESPEEGKVPAKLSREIEERLTWEAVSEFGFMKTHGRTMEGAGASVIGWEHSCVQDTLSRLREAMPGIDPALEALSDEQLRLWLSGLLRRHSERGALYHPYLDSYARYNFWGKNPFGRTIPGRETYPSGNMRYKPVLIVTERDSHHDNILAPSQGGSSLPWHIAWSRRVFSPQNIDETAILDLIKRLLKIGVATGLFRKLHQDGSKEYYAIEIKHTRLYSDTVYLECSETGRPLVCPGHERELWLNAPSMDYYGAAGVYALREFTARQRYYQDRYRKGIIRRVIAQEHTGLLNTEEREDLEKAFSKAKHRDDPNVLTCTSTLEMGIDIGDLSSTMLCSIPPTTASYLQRIGRAGRATGTALIISIVNQKPHDLFFFARPHEMIKGDINPPGCWLDASAVLVRQYLGYCFDTASKQEILKELPGTCSKFIEDMNSTTGHIPKLIEWISVHETELQGSFLARFYADIMDDTRERFLQETAADLIHQRIRQAADEYDRTLKDINNARKRLQQDLQDLDQGDDDRGEIEQELRIMKGRRSTLDRTTTLEILTDSGLLPNYAFPERGVKFYGAVYNKYRGPMEEERPIELTRAASQAIRELGPHNHFYTHSRQFDIQQYAIGSPAEPIIEKWSICGRCGHMRKTDELMKSETRTACPQCGHDEGPGSQLDIGQSRDFIEMSRSQAFSFMEHYESLSSDKKDERERTYYQIVRSYDQTIEAPVGAMGDDRLPFGIEYRSSMVLRENNVGYYGEEATVPFGPGYKAPDGGYILCRHCGVVVPPGKTRDDAHHRRSCPRRKTVEKQKQEGRSGIIYEWENVYLYRELKSEAIRLLLPLVDADDIDTLIACFYLGLRLKFEGDPANLLITTQVMPDPDSVIQEKNYLVIMDAVPGGTGYLKTLYQTKDDLGREGEGIVEVMWLALLTLENCSCRNMNVTGQKDDTDGCYRCIRTYHLQYNAKHISRERGIELLTKLIASAERREQKQKLDQIKNDALFESVLERNFIIALKSFVSPKGKWEDTVIRGKRGFRFSLNDSSRIWEIELQPMLGIGQGVRIQCQPDFLLRCDDDSIRSVAIFTDGFEYHCHPNNRLADDFSKRQSILESGNYHVWSITWDDLETARRKETMVCHEDIVSTLVKFVNSMKSGGQFLPDPVKAAGNGFSQLKAFIECPDSSAWIKLANFLAYLPLQLHLSDNQVDRIDLQKELDKWKDGSSSITLSANSGGDFVYCNSSGFAHDIMTAILQEDIIINKKQENVLIFGRLEDDESSVQESGYRNRWRRFLACMNYYQFAGNFEFWTTQQIENGEEPNISLSHSLRLSDSWQKIHDSIIPSLQQIVRSLAAEEVHEPKVEYFNNDVDEASFAELAWPELDVPVAVLAGEQVSFASQWQRLGWKVVTTDDISSRGLAWLIDLIKGNRQGD